MGMYRPSSPDRGLSPPDLVICRKWSELETGKKKHKSPNVSSTPTQMKKKNFNKVPQTTEEEQSKSYFSEVCGIKVASVCKAP